ncbi:MAG: dTDP-4-dehydrorhamnose 3,5-epimerase [Ignavibacteriae bacterium]|nr:MAG: dTDP-4-dehydrorhamnose 3,5-epimerase [Ignavibacteriota bacterium]
MKVSKTNIEGLLLIEPDLFSDDRGYFFESYNKEKYTEIGLDINFVQDNISQSKKGTVRGLHYQVGDKAQGKLCQVILGRVLDVAVDIRFGSPTFGKHYAHVLNTEKKMQIWIPPGLAHGFSVLSEEAIFSYKCTNYYSKDHERSILYNDSELNIDWQVENPVVSSKDIKAKTIKEIDKDFIYTP